MKTTQGKAVSAYLALTRMGQVRLPSTVAYKLFKLKSALKGAYDFQAEEEQKMIDEFGGKMLENGQIIIGDEAQRGLFKQAQKKLEETEIDVEVNPISLSSAEIREITINDLEALDGFVEF